MSTFTIGLVGAFVGGFLAGGMNLDEWWQVLVVQVEAAAVLVLLVSSLVRVSVTNRRS